MLYEIKHTIYDKNEETWYLIKYEDKIFKANNYNEILNVFYNGSNNDTMIEKENFLYGLIKLVALINNVELIIFNNYKKNYINKKDNMILYKKDISSLISIINSLGIAVILKIIEY